MNTAVFQLILLTRFLSVVVHTLPKYCLLVDRSYRDLLNVTIHASRLKDLFNQFDFTSGNAGRQSTTHKCILTVAN